MEALLQRQLNKLLQKRYKYIFSKYVVSTQDADILRAACLETINSHDMKIRLLVAKLKKDYVQFYNSSTINYTKASFFSNLFCAIDINYLPEKQYDGYTFDTYEIYRMHVKDKTLSGKGLYTNKFSNKVLTQMFDFLIGNTENTWCKKVNFDLTAFYHCLYDAVEDGIPEEVKELFVLLATPATLSVELGENFNLYKGNQMFTMDQAYLTYSCTRNKIKVFLQSEFETIPLSMLYATD